MNKVFAYWAAGLSILSAIVLVVVSSHSAVAMGV